MDFQIDVEFSNSLSFSMIYHRLCILRCGFPSDKVDWPHLLPIIPARVRSIVSPRSSRSFSSLIFLFCLEIENYFRRLTNRVSVFLTAELLSESNPSYHQLLTARLLDFVYSRFVLFPL